MSAVMTCIDAAGNQELSPSTTTAEVLVLFSRLKTFQLHESNGKSVTRSVDYSRWLKDTVPQEFLQTVDPAAANGSRVFYPPGDQNTAPVLRFAYEIVLGESISPRTLLGFFRVNARYEFRCRRGIPLAPA